MLKYTVPMLALAFVAGCGGDKACDTATEDCPDTGAATTVTPPGDDDDVTGVITRLTVFLDVIDPPHCPGGAEWVYHAETTGWTLGTNLVNSWEVGAPEPIWSEEHDLVTVDYGPEYAFDILERTLTPVSDSALFEVNSTTLWQCDVQGGGGSNAYTIRIYDLDGNYADCAIFSDGVAGGVDNVLNRDLNGDFNPVTAPSEINSTDCIEWTVE